MHLLEFRAEWSHVSIPIRKVQKFSRSFWFLWYYTYMTISFRDVGLFPSEFIYQRADRLAMVAAPDDDLASATPGLCIEVLNLIGRGKWSDCDRKFVTAYQHALKRLLNSK